MRVDRKTVIAALCLLGIGGTSAALSAERMREDKTHVRTWNAFAQECLELHERQVAEHEVRSESRVGGYAGEPEFYREVTYYDAETGNVLSKVQWEREDPKSLHAVEVYIHDEQGRILRDYAAAFLPTYRNAPVQTLINLHNYNDGLHGFRQFDASADRIYEYCEGSYQGKPVQIRLFEDQLVGSDDDVEALMQSAEYEACFGDLPERVGKYLTPQ